MSKRIRAITLSCVTVLCCLALIVGGTYALFSDSAEIVNHLQAGELKVSLCRETLSGCVLSDNGLLEKFENNERLEFTKQSLDNVFGLSKDSKLVPGCEFDAKFTLSNNGNVAIGYYLQFVVKGEVNNLAEQLKLTLNTDSNTTTISLSELSENYTWGGKNNPIGQILVGSVGEFSVALEFVDSDSNNDAQGQQISVDMIVHAIQLTTQNQPIGVRKMKKTKQIVLISVLTAAFCCSFIVGSTYALFTDETTTNLSVSSGTVDVRANITRPALYYDDKDGNTSR